jgi:hypothetical protein
MQTFVDLAVAAALCLNSYPFSVGKKLNSSLGFQDACYTPCDPPTWRTFDLTIAPTNVPHLPVPSQFFFFKKKRNISILDRFRQANE